MKNEKRREREGERERERGKKRKRKGGGKNIDKEQKWKNIWERPKVGGEREREKGKRMRKERKERERERERERKWERIKTYWERAKVEKHVLKYVQTITKLDGICKNYFQ